VKDEISHLRGKHLQPGEHRVGPDADLVKRVEATRFATGTIGCLVRLEKWQ
jgi:hypothetical protein